MDKIRSAVGISLYFFLSCFSVFASAETEASNELAQVSGGLGALVIVGLVIGGAIWFIRDLTKKMIDLASSNDKVDKFFNLPLGIPAGSVRSILALVIVSVTLSIIVLQFFFFQSQSVPEGLMTLTAAVVAFYFGTRTSAQGAEATIALETKSMRDDLKSARIEKDQSEAEKLISKLKKASQVMAATSALVPKKYQAKYEKIMEKIQDGLGTADALIGSSNPKEAKDLAEKVFDEFAKNNPVVDTVRSALPVLKNVLQDSIPPLALLVGVATIGVKLGGSLYEKWMRRVLYAPITIAMLPTKTFDGITARILFANTESLALAFSAELQANDENALAQAANDFIKFDTPDLWQRYGTRFESQDQFNSMLLSLRQKLMDQELQGQVERLQLESFASYDQLMSAIDNIHQDDNARAALDEYMFIIDGLMREGQPVLQILDRVKEEVEK